MGMFGGVMGGFGPAGFGGAAAGVASGQGPGQGGGWFGFNSPTGQNGGFGNTSGGRMPGIAGGQATGGRFGPAGFGQQGSQATPTGGAGYAPGNTGPMGTGFTGNALMNAIMNNNFTTPFSLQDAISVVSPSMGQIAGLLGAGGVMSTGPGPSAGTGSSIGVTPNIRSSQSVAQPKPTMQPAANVTPKTYKRPKGMPTPGGFDYLNGAGNMHPLQIRSALAAFNGPFDYYKNVLGQDLIDDKGGLRIGSEVLPSEWDYIRRQGVNVGNNELTKLADLLYT